MDSLVSQYKVAKWLSRWYFDGVSLPVASKRASRASRLNDYSDDCPRPGFDEGEDTLLTPVPPPPHFPVRPKQDEFSALVMNIVVPSITSEAKLPVMVYVHGGSLLYGGANLPIFDAVNLVSQSVQIGRPIVCINFNYRVGLGGFLAGEAIARELHKDGFKGSGNFGFTDQQVAFEWVQNYIACLGGDPNNVTAVGESAGGISISNQLLAAHAPKIHRAVCMSGLAISIPAWSMAQHDKLFDAVCKHFAIDPKSPSVLDQLRGISQIELAEATPVIQGVTSGTGNPCLDGWFHARSPLEIHPAPTWLASYMVGDVFDEAVIFRLNLQQTTYSSLWSLLSAFVKSTEDLAIIFSLYNLTPAQPRADFLRDLEQMIGDAVFKIPNYATFLINNADTAKAQKTRNCYLYHFDQPSRLPNDLEGTAYHAYELLYLFQNRTNDFSSAERTLASSLATAWISFVNGEEPWELLPLGSSQQCKIWGPNGEEQIVRTTDDEDRRGYKRMEKILSLGNGETWKELLAGIDTLVNERWNMGQG